MLSWTLGGYPSFNLEMASGHYWETEADDNGGFADRRSGSVAERLKGKFGDRAGAAIADASRLFSAAFREFPFHIAVAYKAPQNVGPANPLWLMPSGYSATTVCYPYDDLQRWRGIYPEDVFAEQLRKLSEGWQQGIDCLRSAKPQLHPGAENDFTDILHSALGAYYHFRSAYLQTEFVRSRNRWLGADEPSSKEAERVKLLAIVDEEIVLAKQLYDLVRRDSRIGYEASNHYYYTKQDLQEKVLNCLSVREQLQ
ncbi:MAG: hypothetical protein K0Q73_5345, partial [Paenibacillus sp.]|nr:hypothetical protein [Paenibacillus sp.]